MTAMRRFIDRDVRENPDYNRVVEEYLAQYDGEFEFLIDCKMRLTTGKKLTVGMTRGVLNCMKVDPRVDMLPEPGTFSDEDNVIEFQPRNRPKWTSCDITDFHDAHPGDNEHMVFACQGVHRINRAPFDRPAKVKIPYVAGNSGRRIHKTGEAFVRWWPNTHENGFRHAPDLFVRADCRSQPMRDPILMDEAIPWSFENAGKIVEVVLCKVCFPGSQAELF